MRSSYYGLICRHCNGGYPAGEERLGQAKYLFGMEPFILQCVRCGVTDTYDKYVYWLREERYTASQIVTARLRISRARKLFGLF